MKCLKIIVIGRVQGVFFRASTQEKAIELGLQGFVRNELDGSVYLEAQGARVDELLDWIKDGGPRMARVDKTFVEESDPQNFIGFEVTR